MPIYSYKNETTGETKEVYQTMSEEHSYSENGVKWKRVYLSPQARVTSFSNIDPNSYESFNNWLNSGSKGNVGDLWDASKELSAKRETERGKDVIKEKALKQYSAERNGTTHPTMKV